MSDEYEYFNSEEELRAYESAQKGTPHGRKVIESLFPGVKVSSDYRPPSHPLSKKNPDSYHKKSDRAVDIAAIPGMTFEDVAKRIKDEGYDILQMQDEYKNPSKHATGKHWHFVIGDQYEYFNSEEEMLAADAKQPVNAPEKTAESVPEYQPLQTAGAEKTITTGAETAQQADIEATLRGAAKDKIPFKDVADVIEQNYPGQIAKEGKNLQWYYDHYSQGGKSPINWTADKNRVGENDDPNTITVEGDLADVAPYQEEVTYLKDRAQLAASQGSPAAAYRGIRRALGDTGEEVNQDKKEYEAELQAQIDASNAFGNPIIREIAGFVPEMLAGAGPEDLIPILGGATKVGRIAGAVGTNMAADAGLQGIEIAQGSQDAFSPERNLIAGALGGGLQGGGELLVSLAKKYEGKGIGVTERSGKVVEVSDPSAPKAASAPQIKGRTVPGSPKDQKVKTVSEMVAKTTEGWTNSPEIIVYTNIGALAKAEPKIAAAMKADGAAKAPGFYGEDGRIHIIAENVSPDRVQSLVFHEALGHDGLSKEFGEKLAEQMSMIYDRNWTTRREAGNLAMKGYGEAYASTPKSRAAVKAAMKLTNAGERRRALEAAIENDPRMKALLAEEVLAKMSEDGPISKSLLDRIANTIREYGRKMGLKLDLSAREVKAILADAHARVISGEGKATPSGMKYILTTHVSPHEFTNVDSENPYGKFDHSKMGTGEGAQVYGWGTYLGENTRSVYYSKFERELERKGGITVDGTPLRDFAIDLFPKDSVAVQSDFNRALRDVTQELDHYKRNWPEEEQKNIPKKLKAIADRLSEDQKGFTLEYNKLYKEKQALLKLGNEDVRWLTSKMSDMAAEANVAFFKEKIYRGISEKQPKLEISVQKPKTYEVDVPDEIQERMLLWDKPIEDQPQVVQDVAKELGLNHVTKEDMLALEDKKFELDDKAREFWEENLQPHYDEEGKIHDAAHDKALDDIASMSDSEAAKALRLSEKDLKSGPADLIQSRMETYAFKRASEAVKAFRQNSLTYSKNMREYRKISRELDKVYEQIDSARYLNGERLYEEVVKVKGSPKEASLYLASKGIPGNKYEDGFTRGKSGEKSYNYVMYNDEGPDAPKIINKYALNDTELTERTKEKFLLAMKGARRLSEDYAARVAEDRKAKLKGVGAARASTSGKKGLFAELSALKGETTKSYIEPLGGKFSQRETKALFDAFKNAPNLTWFQSIRARQGLLKLMEGDLPTPSELDLMGRVLGRDFVRYALDLRKTGTKMKDWVQEGVGLQRAMISSMDLSAPFRQGWGLMGRKQFWANLAPMLKQAVSKDFHNQVMLSIEEHPYYDLSQKAGLFIAEMGSDLNAREENYASTLADKIPGVSNSNMAYTGFLNKVRFDTFVDMVDKYKSFEDPNLRMDLTDPENLSVAKQLAKHLTVFTGRGSLGKRFESAASFLSMLFFSPRLMASRINILFNGINPLYWHSLHPVARREVARDYAKMSALTATTIGLIKFAFADDEDVDVELDPRSSDFGKIRIGERRYDILGGLGQYLVLGARLATGETKTGKGEVKELKKGAGQTERDVLIRFLINKAAPIPGYVSTGLEGENPVGEEFEPAKDAAALFVPLFLRDLYKGFEEEGLLGAAAATPALFGFGYSKYATVPSKYDAYGRTYAESKKKDPVVQEMEKLQQEEALPIPLIELATNTNLPKDFREVEDVEVLNTFQEVSGKYIMEGLRELIKTEEWRTMTNEDKIAAVRKVKKDSRKLAREEVFGGAE
jgi:hypothetical protein